MKKIFLLVMVFSLLFTAQVSYAADATGRRDSATTVELKSIQPIKYVQDTDIEIDKIRNNKELVLVFDSSSAMEEVVTETGSPFDYALFSGSETEDLELQSGGIKIEGGVHANKSIIQKAGDIYIKGKLEAVEDIVTESGASITGEHSEDSDASVVEMQDLSDKFREASTAEAKVGGSSYFSTAPFPFDTSKRWCDLVVNKVDGKFINSAFIGAGDLGCYLSGTDSWTLTGGDLVLVEGMPLYFEGDVTISSPTISGKGFIVATGDISFSTSNFDSEDIGIYSVNGDVNFHTGGVGLKGVVYAPEGTIRVDSGGLDVEGCLVGDNVSAASGDYEVTYNGDLGSVEKIKEYEDLERTISVAKTASQKFIEKLKDDYLNSDIKINIVTYTDKAEVAFSDFYNITKDGYSVPNDYLKNISLGAEGANLGDGLRRAYYELSGSTDTTADKYIVVLAAGEPNRWTKDDTGVFKTDDGVAGASKIKTGETQAKNYSMEIGGMLSSSEIKSFFIDVASGSTIASLSDIVASVGSNAKLEDPEASGGKGFDQELEETLLTDTAKEIIEDETYLVPDVTVAFTEEIPAQVEVREAPDFEAVTPAGELVLKNNDKVDVVEDGDKIKISLGDIEIKVKYNEFDKSDDLINYPTITATYTITNPVTGDFIGKKEVDIAPLDVTINWSKDVN